MATGTITVTSGQLAFEWVHMQRKLEIRNPHLLRALAADETPACHPLFRKVPGPVAAWERP